jgi:hypothetical protein
MLNDEELENLRALVTITITSNNCGSRIDLYRIPHSEYLGLTAHMGKITWSRAAHASEVPRIAQRVLYLVDEQRWTCGS